MEELGKAAAAADVKKLLRKLQPHLKEKHAACIAKDLAVLQDYQQWCRT